MEWGIILTILRVFIIIKLLGFVVKWRFSLLGISIHSAAETLQQLTHCQCATPSLSVTAKPKLR